MNQENQTTSIPENSKNPLSPNMNISEDWNPDNFEFTPIDEILDLGTEQEDIADEFKRQLNELTPKVNSMIPGNYKVRTAGPTPDASSFDSFARVFDNPDSYMSGVKTDPLINEPIISGAKTSGFDRIYDHHNYEDLGWDPLRDNEKYYNDNTSAFWDFTRAAKHWASSVGTGFMSSYRSFGDLFGDDAWIDPDFTSSDEFAESTRLGSSTRGGFAGGATNIFLQSGYTFGILGSIAAEELALAAATALTFGGASGGFIAGTVRNFGRGIKAMGNLFDIGKSIKASKSILDSIRAVDNARDFWAASKAVGAAPFKLTGDLFAPETMAAIRGFKSAENTAQGLSRLAKVTKTFPHMYRDLRSINFAMSEGKLEAGFAYNEIFSKGLAIEMEKNGGNDLSQTQLEDLNTKALAGATDALMFNAPAIFLSNKLVLGTAMKGFSPMMSKIFSGKTSGFAKNIIRTGKVVGKNGKKTKGLYKDVSPTNWRANFINVKKLKALGAAGTLKATAHGALRYSSANIAEGLQEVYQEGVQVGVVDYHTALMENPMAPTTDLLEQSFKNAVSSQISGQGVEVFMSGFLMGGLVQGPQKLFFEMAPQMYQKRKNPEAFAKYEKNKAEFIKWVNETGDAIQDNPADYFSDIKKRLFSASEGDQQSTASLFENDELGFRDIQDDAAWSNLNFLMKSGAENLFIEQMQDQLKLSDEEIVLFDKTGEKDPAKIRKKIEKTISDTKSYKQKYDKSFNIIKNPYDPSKAKRAFDEVNNDKDATDDQKAQKQIEYNDERLKHDAIEDARMLYLFSGNTFERAIERRNAIEKTLRTSDVMNDLASDDLTVLLSTDSIDNEAALLMLEINNLKKAEKPDNKLIKRKESKLNKLIEYRTALESIYDKESDVYDRDKKNKVKKALVSYLRTLGAVDKKGYIKNDEIDAVISMLIDHNNLDKRAQLLDRTISLFSDPNKLTNLIDRLSAARLDLYKNAKTIFKSNIDKAVMNEEIKQLLNQLDFLNVTPNAQELEKFLETGNSNELTKFYSATGLVTRRNNPELMKKITDFIEVYDKTSTTPESAETTDAQESTEFDSAGEESAREVTDAEFKDIIEGELADEIVSEVNAAPETNVLLQDQSPFSQSVLNSLFNIYKKKALRNKEKALTVDQWINSDQGANALRSLELLKRLWYKSINVSGKTESQIETEYKNETEFQDWIIQNKDEPSVLFGLKLGRLTINNIQSGVSTKSTQQSNKADIEKRRQEELEALPFDEDTLKVLEAVKKKDKARYARELRNKAKKLGAVGTDILERHNAEDALKSSDDIATRVAAKLKIEQNEPFNNNSISDVNSTINEIKKGRLLFGIQETIKEFYEAELAVLERQASDVETTAEGESKSPVDDMIDPKTEKIVQRNKGLNILETKTFDPVTGEATTLYRFVDNYKNPIDPEFLEKAGVNGVYNLETKKEAWSDFAKLLPFVPESSYVYDGVTLEYLDEVENSNGEKFIVLGTEVSESKGQYLKLIPSNQNNLKGAAREVASIYVEEAGFSVEYSKVEEKVAGVKYSTDMTKLDARDVNGIYATQLTNNGQRESIQNAEGRLQEALNILTEEDLNNASITITTNNRAEATSLEFGGKDANPFIKKKGDKYTVKITLSPDALVKVSHLYGDNFDGTIGFIRNDHYAFAGKSGQVISLSEFTDNNIERYLMSSNTSTVAEFRNKEIKQDLFTSALDLLMADNNLTIISFSELAGKAGIQLKKTEGLLSWDGVDKSLNDLAYNTYDGVKVIMTNTKNKKDGSITTSYTTDIEDPLKEIEFINKLEEDLKGTSNGIHGDNYNLALNTGRYVAVVKSSDGVTTIVQLKQDSFSKEERVELYTKLLNRAKETLDNNVKDGSIVNNQFNFDWNDNFNSEFYLSSVPGSFVDLKVKEDGNIVLRLKVKSDSGNNLNVSVRIRANQLDEFIADPMKIESLLSEINEDPRTIAFNNVNKNKVNLSAASMTKVFDVTAPINEIIEKTKTDIDPQVRVNKRMYLDYTSDVAPASSVIAKPKAKDQVESEKPVDTNEVSQETLEEIATKIDDGGNVTPQDFAIYEANSDAIDNIRTSREAKKESSEEIKPAVNTLEEQITELENQKKTLEAEINKEAKAKGVNRFVLKTESKEYQILVNEIKSLKAKRKNAFKIVGTSEALAEDLKIDEFIDWAQKNLPDFIQIRDINEIKDRLKAKGYTAGQFTMALRNLAGGMSIEGTIYTGPSAMIAYHEAFHSVFRMLLSDQEQTRLLSLAKDEVRKKFKTTEALMQDMERFKNSHDMYAQMSAKRLEREYLEEYMADEFAKFKQNPRSTKTASGIKSIFNRIIEWVKSVLKAFKKNDLINLYENIDSGKFRNGATQDNFYTRGLDGDVTMDAYKAIPYESIQGELFASDLFLDPSTADVLVRTIANTYLTRRENSELSDNVLIGTVIEDYVDLYFPGRDIYSGDKLSDKQAENLEKVYNALTLNDGQAIKDEVETYIGLFNQKFEQAEEETDELEQEVGTKSVEQYGKESQEIGIQPGQRVRLYLASTTLESVDMFGNTELLNGEPIKVPVKYQDVYNGLMLASMNQSSHFEMLKRMYYHSRRSLNTSTVIDRFLNDVGITNQERSMEDVIESGQLPAQLKDSKLFLEFVKTFQNSRFDYLFHLRDATTNKAIIISASQSDAANAQIDAWKKFFGDKFELFKNNPKALTAAQNTTNLLLSVLSKSNMTNKDLQKYADKLSKDIFNNLGISFSRGFLEVSIASALKNKNTVLQKELSVIGENNNLITVKDAKQFVERLSAKVPLEEGSKILVDAPENLFIDDAGKGMSSRMHKLALGNANFDEAIGATVFTDVNNKLIYAHQKQTYHSKRISELNDTALLDNLVESDEFLINNLLLSSLAFRQLAEDNMLTIQRVSGTKDTEITDAKIDNLSEAKMKDSGVTYGDMNSAQFLTTLVNLYTASYNTKNETNETIDYTDEAGQLKSVAKAPVLLRIMEASNTNDLVQLPVVKMVELAKSGKPMLTDGAINLFVEEVKREYNAIRKNFQDGAQGPNGIKGYNDAESERADKGRGFKFFKMEYFIKPVAESLVSFAKQNESFDKIKDQLGVDAVVQDALLESLKELNSVIANEEIIFSDLIRGILPKSEKGARAMQQLNLLENNVEHNIAQIYFNNLINTISINQLILGEEAKLFKDAFVDPIKRGKMQNAAHTPVNTSIIDPALGITHIMGDESIALMTATDASFNQRFTTLQARGKGDKMDAQTYVTVKGARYFAFGLGELNPQYAEMLDKIEAGEEITSDEWFGTKDKKGYLKAKAILNSKKYVYGDGRTFVKMSSVVLTKQETSVWDGSKWVAKVGMEELHNLRENMEAFEKENPTKVSFMAPESAVKMLKQKVQKIEKLSSENANLTNDDVTFINAKDFGLQQVNPSNKLEVTLPNQIKSLITSEQSDDEVVFIDGNKFSIKDVREQYHKLTAAGVNFEFSQKKNLMFDILPGLDPALLDEMIKDGSLKPDLATFLRSAQANLKTSAAASNMVEFFADENGVAKYELNNTLTIKKFEQFFLSYFSKKVLAEKVTGHALALKSDFGKTIIRKVYSLDANGNLDKQEVVRRKVYEKQGNAPIAIDLTKEGGFDALKEALKDNPNGVTVIDRLRVDLPEYSKVGEVKDWKATNVRYAESIVPAHYKEVMDLIENKKGRIPDTVAKMFIVRIPSQDKHSAMNVRVVDFDPVFNGSTGVFPEELIEVSGADFDIDKVFAHTKDWYVKNNKFIEYGRSNATQEEQFEDYVTNVNKLVSKKGTYLYDALYKYKTAGISKSESFTNEEIEDIKNAFLTARPLSKDEKIELKLKEDAVKALAVLGLPKTFAEYLEYKKKNNNVEPYKAAINNNLLDYKITLHGNKAMTEASEGNIPLAFQPADVEELKLEVKRLFKQFPDLANLSKEDLPIDGLPGQYYTHTNVKQNSNLIGAVVPRNVVMNFLKEVGVTLNDNWGSLKVNGENFNKFEDFVKDDEGLRTQYLISNIISAATDDAKERLLSKLGFVKPAISVVETMVGMGMPLHTATMFVNVPFIRESLKNNDITEIKNQAKILKNKNVKASEVNDETLAKAINNKVSQEELLGIYNAFLKFDDARIFIDKLIPVFNLTNGFGKDFSSLNEREDAIEGLGLNMTDAEFKKANLPFDIRKRVKNHWISEYLKINNDFKNNMLPQVFLTQTENFEELYNSVASYSSLRDSASKDKLYKNILTYVTMKAYMNKVLKNEEISDIIGTSLNNEFIYPTSESSFNINSVYERLREKYQGKGNYFLDYYLFNQPAFAENNTTGLNTVTTNSFGKVNPNEKIRIQNGFHQLYGETETRADAVHILHYAMIKDGLQYDNGSIIDALIPFTMENYLSSASDAFNAFKSNQNFEEVFGATFQELKDELALGYGSSAAHSKNVYNFKPSFLFNSETGSFKYSTTVVNGELTYRIKDKSDKNLFEFPLYVKIENAELGTTSYYRLDRASLKSKDVMTKRGNGKIKADAATYVKFELKGAYKQNAVGFMFDTENFERPTVKELRDYRSNLNPKFNNSSLEGSIDDASLEAALPDGINDVSNKLAAFNNQPRTATDKSIQIDGVDISEAKAPEGIKDASSKLAAFAKPTQQTSEVKSAFEILEDNNQIFIENSLEILIKREGKKGVSEQQLAQALINASDKQDSLGSILQSVKVGISESSTLGEKRRVKKYEDALFNLLQPTQQASEVKEGVAELFESNPELAAEVYEALGFKVSNSSINLDKIINTKVGESVTLFINNIPVKYKRVSENYFEGKQITKKQETDFINSVEATTTPIEEFIENEGTEVRYPLDKFINFYLNKLPKNQITPQQKQEAQQKYSEYLNTVFPDSQIKDIAYHWARVPFELYDKSKRVALSSDLGEYLNLSVNPNTWKDYAARTAEGEPVKQTYILNLKNPIITKDFYAKYFVGETERDQFESDQEFWKFLEKNYDGILQNQGEQLAVFNDETNALRLGSKKDIQGFKDFVSGLTQQVSEVDNLTDPTAGLNEDFFGDLNDPGLQMKLDFEVSDVTEQITDFYNEFIKNNQEAKSALEKARIGTTLKGFEESFKSSNFEKIEDFLDDANCHLK